MQQNKCVVHATVMVCSIRDTADRAQQTEHSRQGQHSTLLGNYKYLPRQEQGWQQEAEQERGSRKLRQAARQQEAEQERGSRSKAGSRAGS